MPWYTFGLGKKPPKVSKDYSPEAFERALTAAATSVNTRTASSSFLSSSESWQNEVWSYYDTLGEYRYGVDWKARMMSRVRLYAARIDPTQDEPIRLDDDSLAVRLVSRLGGAVEQPAMLADISTQLDVPGEGFVIAEVIDGVESWTVRSRDEIRKRSGIVEVVDEDTLSNTQEWRSLAAENFVMRIFHPHKRYHYMADSASRAARGTMREIELVNRHILAQYLSRLASAGVWLVPEEITFPVREEFADQPDPFMAEWIEIAAEAIQKPGTASAVVPIPMKIPGEWISAAKDGFIDFTLQIDEQVIEKRESAIRRLATQINIPAEILTGMGAVNHWGAWQLEEGAVKTSIAPDVEDVCSAFTKQYLRPRLAASGEDDPNQFVVWYDLSEITIRPDRSEKAIQLYDRLELSGEAARREAGFNESDKPEDEELREQGLKVIINSLPSGAASALAQLVGDQQVDPVIPISAQSPEEAEQAEERSSAEQRTEPDTQNNPPPSPDASGLRIERLVQQAKERHLIEFNGFGQWSLHHSQTCKDHIYSCPFTQWMLTTKHRALPARSGLYECSFSSGGVLRIGDLSPLENTEGLISSGWKGSFDRRNKLNGHSS